MRYEKLIEDFVDRTKQNLSVIIEGLLKDGVKVFETTQLINSCLGLIVLPREQDLQRIPKKSLKELQRHGWPIPSMNNQSDQIRDLKDMICYLRNAIAHFNIEFTHDSHDEIDGLKLWNQENRQSPKKRESTLTVDGLRLFVEKFSDDILQNLKD